MDDQGNAWIGYALNLRWLGFPLTLHQSLLSQEGGLKVDLEQAAAHSRGTFTHNATHFSCPLFTVKSHPFSTPPIHERLWAHKHKKVEWNCSHPHAALEVQLKDTLLMGKGYVEQITMNLPPWKLPIQTLHWGRFVSKQHAIIWIRWQWPLEERSWIFLDGKRTESGHISLDNIRLDQEAVSLDIHNVRTLVEEKPFKHLRSKLGWLRFLLPQHLDHSTETKWLAKGKLHMPQQKEEEGWVIHEEVQFT
ncbi:MAG: hypothetical protein ROO73_01840 [Roseivirga sp.]